MTEYPLPPQPQPEFPPPAETGTPRRRPGRRRALVAGIGVLAVAGGAVGLGVATTRDRTVQGTGTVAAGSTILPRWGTGLDSGLGSAGGYGSSGSSAQQQASAAEQIGVVDIDTMLGYQNAEAAGTGTVVTSTGEILTNNHVIDGATKIAVTVVSTGKTYAAKVVGTDPTADVAVLQLTGASGLKTANYGTDGSLTVGERVTGVGNAGGVGGTPSAADGTIIALNKAITASDENGGNAERLTGLIETNADIRAGDSGGPLYDTGGEIIGMDTAASAPGTQTTAGYAIPIEHALAIATQIEAATASTSTIHVGNPAFLGVSVEATGGQGAGVAQIATGTPAARAGLAAGDTITAVNGTVVHTPAGLVNALSAYRPGDSVTVTWTDASGRNHSAKITLASGPAD